MTLLAAVAALAAAGAVVVLWVGIAGRRDRAGAGRSGESAARTGDAAAADEDELEQRLLSIESKIRDLDLLRSALVGAAGDLDVRAIVEKQDAILSYLRGYHDKYQGLLLARAAAEGLRGLREAGLGVEAEIGGVAELKKALRQRHASLRERFPGGSHAELDRRMAEVERRIDAALRGIVITETNRIIASESPLARDGRAGRDRAEAPNADGASVGDGGETEESLNREYDRFISEMELS